MVKLFCLLLFAVSIAGAWSHGQMPMPQDPMAARVQHCMEISQGNPKQAITEATSILDEKDIPTPARLGALSCLAHAEGVAGNLPEAQKKAAQLLLEVKQTPMPDIPRAANFASVAEVDLMTGDTQQATDLLQQAHNLVKDKEIPPLEIEILVGLGTLYGDLMGDPLSAEPYFRDAYDISKQKMGRDDVLLAFNYAYTLVCTQKYAEAGALLNHALQLAGSDPRYTGIKYRTMTTQARVSVEQQHAAEAIKLLNVSIAGQQSIHDKEGEAVSQLILAKAQLLAGDKDKARTAAQLSVAMATAIRKQSLRREALHQLAVIEEAAGNVQDVQALKLQEHDAGEMLAKQQTSAHVAALSSQMHDQAILQTNKQLSENLRQQKKQAVHSRWLLGASFVALGVVILLSGSFLIHQKRVSQKLHQLSTTDSLTGLLNRRQAAHTLETLQREIQRGDSLKAVLMLLDVDHFKSINDSHGHHVGDAVLKALALRIQSQCRPFDVVGRWGGEEFVIVAYEISFSDAASLAERLRAIVAATPIELADGSRIAVSVSIGFAAFPFYDRSRDETWKNGIHLADCMLYAAKHSGRDIWVGLRGVAEAEGGNPSVGDVLHDIEQAVARGWVEVKSSKTVQMPPFTRRANRESR